LLKNNKELYKFIQSSKQKYSCKSAQNLLSPIEKYFQADSDNEIHIINLGKYEFNKSILNSHIPIDNIGVAIWNYKKDNETRFDNLFISYNKKIEFFKGQYIIEKELEIFNTPKKNNRIHALLFLLQKKKNKIDKKIKEFLNKKRKDKELFFGTLKDIKKKFKKEED